MVFMDLFRSLSRIGAGIVSGLTILTLVFSGPMTPSAFAQGKNILDKTPGAPGMLATIGEDLPRRINAAFENIQYELIGAGTMAFMNVMQTVMGQVAYDAANYIASGGKGESALFYQKGFSGYLQDIGSSALGEFMGSLSDSSFFHTIGFDLCRPPNPQTLLRIQLSLGNFLPSQGRFSRPQARCDFNDVIQNYNQVYQSLSNTDVLRNIDANLNTNSNDLGVAFNIFGRSMEYVTHQQDTAEKDRKEGNGWRTLSDMVSGRIRTPSDTIREEANQLLVKDPKATEAQINTAILQNAWEMGPTRLATYTASVFLNTLSSKLLNRIMKDGISLGNIADLFKPGPNTSALRGPDDLLDGNGTDARNANIDLRTPSLFKNAAFDLVSEMQGCPTDNRGAWNCTIDEGFAQAIQTRTEDGRFTIQEALNRGYLHPNWKLIPSTSYREERDPLCYTYAYCSGNLRKLRTMRILPVGAEFAANSVENKLNCKSPKGCTTLGQVVAAFNDCNSTGQRDDAHPWCHLIDPDWVLTSLPQQCALSGYGDSMLSPNLPQRREECQDVQTCLSRNDKGECVGGYGYCVAEKTVYRFGAQECSARFASCRSYQSRAGEGVSYLRNTLDYGKCSQDNVGCLWYATQQDPSGGRTDAWVGTVSDGPRQYFDNTLEECAADQAGCTKLLAVKEGESALNLVANPSFERFNRAGDDLVNWSPLSAGATGGFVAPTVDTGSKNLDGAMGAGFAGAYTGGYQQAIRVAPGRTYTFSFFARLQHTATGAGLAALIQQFRSSEPAPGSEVDRASIDRDYRSTDCTLVGAQIGVANATTGLTGSDWKQFECVFATNASTQSLVLSLRGSDVLVDAVSLTEDASEAPFIDGINTTLIPTYMKVAPDEFNCQGDDRDHPACAQYAKVCKQTEAGCDGFTDASGLFPEVPAQMSNNDTCPNVCVGYAEYLKLASSFDLVKNDNPAWSDPTDASSSYFIAKSAQSCTQEEVGCEAFTNIASSTQGGESLEYFSGIRSCEKPDADSQTYFTWEGSDAAGYQLRTWSLKKRTATRSGEPAPEGALATTGAGPLISRNRSADLFGEQNPLNCNEATWRTRADSDCRQFYDSAGNVFYRYYSQTVLSTEDCVPYRLSNTNINDCQNTGGVFHADSGACVYQVYAPESRTCSARAVGCRAYAGAEAGNLQTVFSATGAAGLIDGARVSNEALMVGDSSYRADVPAGRQGSIVADFDSDPTGLYRATFWAKSSAPASLVLRAIKPENASISEVVGTVPLTAQWQRVSLGMFNGARDSRGTTLSWTVSAVDARTAVAFFVDEITVQRLQDFVFVNKDSWKTPTECDQSAFGIPQPQAMLGCREYKNRAGMTVDARQFSRLCRQAAIGCKAFVDTRNTETVAAQTFVRGDTPVVPGYGAATTTRLGARYAYLIDDPNKHCDASNMSCRAFGKPVFSEDRTTVAHFDTVYFKDDITKYSDALCKPSEAFCEEFTMGTGGKEYFKDPQDHACEYRENVTLPGSTGIPAGIYGGWFQKGKDLPCYPNALASGSIFNLLRTGDVTAPLQYQGWAGLCPVEESECTEFRDPNDTSGGVVAGRPYYFVKNAQVDTSSCNGTVDLSRGCILLRDTTDAHVGYNSMATYQAYQRTHAGVAPVDCAQDVANPACRASVQARTVCRPVTAVTTVGNGSLASAASTVTGGSTVTASTGPTTVSSLGVVAVTTSACTPPSNVNDANMVVKVSLDRDCSQWLGCSGSETVYDPALNRYRDICTSMALCDRASEQNGANAYCANYVNRTSTSTEPVLTAGAYFDAQAYAKRQVGVGQRDYSGYSLPDAFQVADLKSVRITVDGNVQTIGRTAAQDYRLAAMIVMSPVIPSSTAGEVQHIVRPTQPNQAEIIPVHDPLSVATGHNNLCRQLGTGQIGFYNKSLINSRSSDGKPIPCYLAIHGGSDEFSFTKLATRLVALGVNKSDGILDQAYPQPICRANPESDSPFAGSVVEKWDRTKNPIAAQTKIAGYENANTCEFGEDCVCSYKRAEFAGVNGAKFYGVNSQAVPPGICQGGPRDGQACLPDEVFSLSTVSSTSAGSVKIAEGSNAAQTCGAPEAGGHCIAFSKLEIVRGVFGNCLEQDTTRARGKLGQEAYPCLTWNPTPVLFGERDPYHYVPTAGYFPPQNSGQYYCTSRAKAASSRYLNASDFSILPHGVNKLDYDDAWVSDGSGNIGGGNKVGSYLDFNRPEGTLAASQCEEADDDQNNDGNDADPLGLRLVTTGRGVDRSYTETFYGVNPTTFARAAYGLSSNVGAAAIGANRLRQGLYESNIGFIEMTPFKNPNGNGRLACGYQENWVDGVNVDNYDDVDKTAPADRIWHEKFAAETDYNPYFTRGNEEIVKDYTGKPMLGPCVRLGGANAAMDAASIAGEAPVDAKCYFKTWESQYRSTDQEKFVAFKDSDENSFSSIADAPVESNCKSDKPYYAAKAVFQTLGSIQGFSSTEAPNPRDIKGPWRFVGFWVSACGGKNVGDDRFIYMNVRIQKADICRDLAEVRSKDSNQDAAFTDRVWSQSSYSVPQLGITYGATYAPFSSALNTGIADTDPLFQTGGRLVGSSALNPPTFLASGASSYYSSAVEAPRKKWAYLSNLFARIYRVYHYNEQRIGPDARTCLSGINAGKLCTPDLPTDGSGILPNFGPSRDCRPEAPTPRGACRPVARPQDLPTTKVCNSLSGVNAGVACAGDPDSCHLYVRNPNTNRPLQVPCDVQPGWVKNSDDNTWTQPGRTTHISQSMAYGRGAFRCAAGAVTKRSYDLMYSGGGDYPVVGGTVFCSNPTDGRPSRECPMEVTGECRKPAGAGATTPGTCFITWPGESTPHQITTSVCFNADECSFNERHFWLDRPWGQDLNPPLTGGGSGVNQRREDGRGAPIFVTTRIGPGDSFTWNPLGVSDNRALLNAPNGTDPWRTLGAMRHTTLGVLYDNTVNDDFGHPANNNLPGSHANQEIMSLSSTWSGPHQPIDLTLRRYPGADAISLNPDGTVMGPASPGNQFWLVGACEPVNKLVTRATGAYLGLTAGICESGPTEGNICFASSDFPLTGVDDIAGSVTADAIRTGSEHSGWIMPGTACAEPTPAVGDDMCQPVSQSGTGLSAIPAARCRIVGGPPEEDAGHYWSRNHVPSDQQNMNDDNNTCTTETGYTPDARLCPDPSNEYCGLIAYDIRDVSNHGSLDPDLTPDPTHPIAAVLPTDVTLGHYTPSYLGFTRSDIGAERYNYIDYYTPRPPRIAAPDTLHCTSSSSCPVQSFDRFAFNGVTEGIQNVAGGQQRSTIRFYGWAAHNQMAIRRLTVDWGDGTVQDFSDAKLKNHKPFCAVDKECYSPAEGFTGLTCQSDNDCPLSAQACRQMGSCRNKSATVCSQDSDCQRDGSQDTCAIRPFFGNSAEACEASYFDFAHVYACSPQSKDTLPSCSGQNPLGSAPAETVSTDVIPSGVVNPSGSTPGTCYYGAQDSFLVSNVFTSRPTCTATGTTGRDECTRALTAPSIGGVVTPGMVIQCGRGSGATTAAMSTQYTLAAPTQGRCSRDTTRFCTADTQCAAGDRCIVSGLAPPGGCWDTTIGSCRFTPRVFVQDNWGWCTGECRTEQIGDALIDNRTTATVLHQYGGCYSGRAEDGDRESVVQLNTGGPRRFSPFYEANECAIDHPNGSFSGSTGSARPSTQERSYRPWIVYPGSLQLRSRP